MNVLDVLTLAAVAATKDKSTIDPKEFFGLETEVKSLCESPNQALRELLKQHAGINWDGKSRLIETILANAKEHCAADRILAELGTSERRYQNALDIVKYDRAIPNTLSAHVVKDAEKVVLDWKRKSIREPGQEDETTVSKEEVLA